MKSCKAISRLLSEAQDRPLSVSELAALRVHTLMCKPCRNFEKHLQMLRQTMRAFAKGEFELKKDEDEQG